MITLDQVAATLRYLIPGFVALKVLYQFGLHGRRSDLELTLWSVLVAAGIDAAVTWWAPASDPTERMARATVIAIVLGAVAALAWTRLTFRFPSLRARMVPRAWDAALNKRPSRWVEVRLKSGDILQGWPEVFALSSDSDVLDMLLADPCWIVDGKVLEMTGVESVLIPEASIELLEVIKPDAPVLPDA